MTRTVRRRVHLRWLPGVAPGALPPAADMHTLRGTGGFRRRLVRIEAETERSSSGSFATAPPGAHWEGWRGRERGVTTA